MVTINIEKRHLYVIAVLFVLLAGVVVVAYGNPYGSPAILGHTASEINFEFVEVWTDCTSYPESNSVCDASCSSGYKAISGACYSYWGENWDFFGITNNQMTWRCHDSSHTAGKDFKAKVLCIKTG